MGEGKIDFISKRYQIMDPFREVHEQAYPLPVIQTESMRAGKTRPAHV